jgi:S-layer protein (TIGR01564 family)
MTIAGSDHTFWVDTDGDTIAVDLDGTDELEAARTVNIMFKGEGYLAMPVQTFTTNDTLVQAAEAGEKFILTTPKEQFDDQPGADETTNITVTGDDTADEQVGLSIAGAGDTIGDPNADDWEYGMTDYGVYLKLNDPSGSNEAESLAIEYPLSQRGAQVFVTAGVIEVSEGSEISGGKISSTMLNPIGVGMAVLDTDAESSYGSKKMIVVGGPCVNTIAAKLMGNPADCTAGFTPGKAIIKLFADKNALLVAGYNAQDTVGACYVLGDYKDYKLTGTEVEVVVADLKNLVVNKVQ